MKPLTLAEIKALPADTVIWFVGYGRVDYMTASYAIEDDWIESDRLFTTKEAAEEQLKYEQLLNKLGKKDNSISRLTLDDYGRTYAYTDKIKDL